MSKLNVRHATAPAPHEMAKELLTTPQGAERELGVDPEHGTPKATSWQALARLTTVDESRSHVKIKPARARTAP